MQLSDERGRVIALHHLVRYVQKASKLRETGKEEEGHLAATHTVCVCIHITIQAQEVQLTCLKQRCGEGVM